MNFISYQDFVKYFLKTNKCILDIGSSSTSHIEATEDFINENLKEFILHYFINSDFYYNYLDTDDKKIYYNYALQYFDILKYNNILFEDFYKKYLINSNRYNSVFQFNKNLSDEAHNFLIKQYSNKEIINKYNNFLKTLK